MVLEARYCSFIFAVNCKYILKFQILDLYYVGVRFLWCTLQNLFLLSNNVAIFFFNYKDSTGYKYCFLALYHTELAKGLKRQSRR